ncbi:MAG: formimidoylglutamase [Candidatus Marinimicrobia bacterium]|nr:formimidoylglutamase [Candidatus Neomarinimicrobiota bacterium]
MSTVPHTTPPAVIFPEDLSRAGDPRLKHRILPWTGDPADVALLGVPYDEGVALNGGRVGAAEGPQAFRQAVLRFGTTYDAGRGLSFDHLTIADAGDLDVIPGDPAGTHQRLSEAVEVITGSGAIPVIIGGGNDATFGSAQGLSLTYGDIGGANIDAHLDMREVIDGVCHSGTPYRRILEELRVPGERIVELGLHSATNSAEHLQYAAEHRVGCWGLEQLREAGPANILNGQLNRLSAGADALFVSIDLDVFSAAFAPGVSAPGTEGLTPGEGRAMAFVAGRHRSVKLFELMEFSPPHDIDQRTGRLAVLLLHAFLSGLASRKN